MSRIVRMAFLASAVLLVVTVIAAAYGINDAPPSCPPDYELVRPQSQPEGLCFNLTNKTDPTGYQTLPPTVGRNWSERGVVLLVGVLGVLALITFGLRVRSESGSSKGPKHQKA